MMSTGKKITGLYDAIPIALVLMSEHFAGAETDTWDALTPLEWRIHFVKQALVKFEEMTPEQLGEFLVTHYPMEDFTDG